MKIIFDSTKRAENRVMFTDAHDRVFPIDNYKIVVEYDGLEVTFSRWGTAKERKQTAKLLREKRMKEKPSLNDLCTKVIDDSMKIWSQVRSLYYRTFQREVPKELTLDAAVKEIEEHFKALDVKGVKLD